MKFVVALSLLFITVNALADELVFEGIPTALEISQPNVAPTVKAMHGADAVEAAVKIVRRGDRIIWASRNDTELFATTSGAYLNLIATNGSGYIRISTLDGQYSEHLTMMLNTFTYRGEMKPQ